MIEIQVITDFSRMDFPTLISYTSPFFEPRVAWWYLYFYIQILIEHFIRTEQNRNIRNHGDPDQRPRSVASDLGLQCLFFLCPSTRTLG